MSDVFRVVEKYTPHPSRRTWVGHLTVLVRLQSMAPEMMKYKKKFGNQINFVSLNAEREENAQVCAAHLSKCLW